MRGVSYVCRCAWGRSIAIAHATYGRIHLRAHRYRAIWLHPTCAKQASRCEIRQLGRMCQSTRLCYHQRTAADYIKSTIENLHISKKWPSLLVLIDRISGWRMILISMIVWRKTMSSLQLSSTLW